MKMKALLTGIGVVLMLILSLSLTPAQAAFTASVNSNANNIGTGTSFLTAAKGGTRQCSSEPTSASISTNETFICSGTQIPAAVPTTGSTPSAVSLTSTGTANFASATYDASSCRPVVVANTGSSTNPLLVRGGITYQAGAVTGVSGSNSTGFNGTNSTAVEVTQGTPLQDFTAGIWFRTTAASGGLFSWTNSSGNAAPTQDDRHLFLNGAGRLSFGTLDSSRVVTTPAAYNDGQWHFAVAVAQSNTGPGNQTGRTRLTIYVDGVEHANSLFTGATAAGNFSGHWRLGQAYATTADGWTGTGSRFFTGSLSNFTVVPSVITATQVSTWRSQATQATFQSYATTLGAQELWALNDSTRVGYSGTYPAGVVDPCTHVAVTVASSAPARCLHPALETACPSLSGFNTLATLGQMSPVSMTTPLIGTPQTVTTFVVRAANYSTAFDTGLHLIVPATVTTGGFVQSFSWVNEIVI